MYLMPVIFGPPEMRKREERAGRRLQRVGLPTFHSLGIIFKQAQKLKQKARLCGSQMMSIHHLFPTAFASRDTLPVKRTPYGVSPRIYAVWTFLPRKKQGRLPTIQCVVYQMGA